MFFIHDSVKRDRFKGDKKLNLLKNGVITIPQFINLIEPRDEYIMMGPALVAKDSINQFILEWKMKQTDINMSDTEVAFVKMTNDELFDNLDKLCSVFPEVELYVNEFKEQMKVAVCPKCVKKKYLSVIFQYVQRLEKDGRDISSVKEFIDVLRLKFDNDAKSDEFFSNNIEWLKPEEFTGLGKDLIENLDNCFDCVIKHIRKSKDII